MPFSLFLDSHETTQTRPVSLYNYRRNNDDYFPCVQCQIHISLSNLVDVYTSRFSSGPTALYCQPCADEHAFRCRHNCGAFYLRDCSGGQCEGHRVPFYVCPGCWEDVPSCDYCGIYSCVHDPDECEENRDRYYSSSVHDYGYKPRAIFNGVGPVYLGFENEITTHDMTLSELFEGTVVYCKEDGSVAGFEMVSHPMSYDWAMENFPWDLYKKLSDAGAEGSINGLHVHISRSAFTDEAHTLRWMLLIYRNKDSMIRLARRECAEWASFADEVDCERKATGVQIGRRYVAINAGNSETFEARFFASTLDPEEAQAALGLIDASCEYTRTLSTITAVTQGAEGWQTFFEWVKAQEKYGPLVSQMQQLTEVKW